LNIQKEGREEEKIRRAGRYELNIQREAREEEKIRRAGRKES
jgi:hypothetical protein